MNRPHDRDSQGPKVGLFIDYDHLAQAPHEAAGLALRCRELAEERGRLVLARAYGDWTAARQEAHEFDRAEIEPRLVLHVADAERTALELSLDALQTLSAGPHLDVYVLVTGGNPYQPLAARLRQADRTVVVIAGAGELAAARGSGEDTARRRRAGAAPARHADSAGSDWTPFVLLLEELEGSMPFVGFGWLLKKKLNPENCGCYSLQERQELMDRATEEGILVLYKVDNIEQGGDPVTACKLNREHPGVRSILER